MIAPEDEARVARTIDRLHARFSDSVERGVLDARVRARFARFEDAAVREFVPILVEREIVDELRRVPHLTARA